MKVVSDLLECIDTIGSIDFLDKHDWYYISVDESVTWDFIQKHPTYKWNIFGVSRNPNVTLDIINTNPEYDWDWSGVSLNPNITPEFIEKNWDKINWKFLSKNPIITWKFITDHDEYPWDWGYITGNPNITWDNILSRLDKEWDWEELIFVTTTCGLQNRNTPPSYFIEKTIDKPWSFKKLSYCSGLSWNLVKNNLDKDWDWDMLYKVNPEIAKKAIEELSREELFKCGCLYLFRSPYVTRAFIEKLQPLDVDCVEYRPLFSSSNIVVDGTSVSNWEKPKIDYGGIFRGPIMISRGMNHGSIIDLCN